MEWHRVQDLRLDQAMAEASSGKRKAALQDIESILARSGDPSDPGDSASLKLAAGSVYLAAGDAQAALGKAADAELYFESRGLLDSELRSALLARKAAKILRDSTSERVFTAKSVDIMGALSHTWPPPVFHSYISRPDIRTLVREVAPQSN
jgi:hypothetical protein